MGALVTSLPSWVLFLLIFGIGIGAAELGARFIRSRERNDNKEKQGPAGSLLGALLALLAFMLGFTFSVAISRFSERKHLVIDQAKAIGTSYLRTSLLPDRQQKESKRLYHDYINILVNVSHSDVIESEITKLEGIQSQLWNQAASLKNESMDAPLKALYISSVNEVIDIFGERKTVVLIFRIPGTVWTVLLVLYLFSMFVVGLENSSFKLRRNLNVPIMTAAFALVVVLISAMDKSTKAGQFTLSQQPLIDVQQMIKQDIAHIPQ